MKPLPSEVKAYLNRTAAAVAFIGALGAELWHELHHLKKFRMRETLYYLDLCGRKSLPIVLLICTLMGLILGFQAAVQARKIGMEMLVADAVGIVIIKELGPLMVAMIATGRAGSAFAAEIGTMKVNEEISAMATMGISPERLLVIPKLTAMLISMPLLSVFGDAAGIFGGLFVGVTMLDIPTAAYWARTVEIISPTSFLLGLAKSFVFGALITLAGCWRGFQAQADAQGVGRCATDAVVDSIFLVVIADALITIFYSTFGY